MQEDGGGGDAGGYALWSAMAKETDSLTRQLALLSADPKFKVDIQNRWWFLVLGLAVCVFRFVCVFCVCLCSCCVFLWRALLEFF